MLLGLLWIPIMPAISKGGLYQYLQNVQGYLAPPITAVFLLGIFVQRINARGAVWGLTVGFVLGMLKLIAQGTYGAGLVDGPAFMAAIAEFNFLYFSGVLFLISVAITVGISHTAPAPSTEQIRGLTFATIDRKAVRDSWDKREVIATVVVLGAVAAIYLYFSFWI